MIIITMIYIHSILLTAISSIDVSVMALFAVKNPRPTSDFAPCIETEILTFEWFFKNVFIIYLSAPILNWRCEIVARDWFEETTQRPKYSVKQHSNNQVAFM